MSGWELYSPLPHARRSRRWPALSVTGDFTLTLPVMLAVAVGTTVSRALSYGTIYTTKLLRRGIDIDRPTTNHAFAEHTAADAMHRFTDPFDLTRDGTRTGTGRHCLARYPGSRTTGASGRRRLATSLGSWTPTAVRDSRSSTPSTFRPGLAAQPERATRGRY